jgi:hypothetical protein
VISYWKCGRKVGWNVKWHGKHGRKAKPTILPHFRISFNYSTLFSSILYIYYQYSTFLSSMFSMSFPISTYLSFIFGTIWKKGKLISEKTGKIWKKGRLNSENIWKILKKPKLNSENILKIEKQIVKWYGKYGRKVSWNVKWSLSNCEPLFAFWERKLPSINYFPASK